MSSFYVCLCVITNCKLLDASEKGTIRSCFCKKSCHPGLATLMDTHDLDGWIDLGICNLVSGAPHKYILAHAELLHLIGVPAVILVVRLRRV